MKRKAFLLAPVIFLASFAWAQVTPLINFQGRLTDPNGINKPDGTYKIVFKIWDQATGGNELWIETQNDVPVRNGIFQVFLGQYTSSPTLSGVFSGADRFIEITVDNDSAMVPRMRVGTIPYAIQAAYASELAGGTTVQGTINAAKFIGDGSGLTDITASDGSRVAKSGDSMTGPLTLSGSTLTVTGNGFSVGNSTFIVKGGKVGVGTSDPEWKLHVRDSAIGTIGAQIRNTNTVSGQERLASLEVTADTGTAVVIQTGVDSSNRSYQMVYGTNILQLGVGGNERMRIRDIDEITEGTMTALFGRWVSQHAYLNFMVGYDGNNAAKFSIRGDGGYFNLSSRDSKTEITPIFRPLDIVGRLNGVYYKYRDDLAGRRQIGFIAEDLEQEVPEVVDEKLKMVNYSALVPLLAESIKELKGRVEELERKTGVRTP